jgi:hypothetical protein
MPNPPQEAPGGQQTRRRALTREQVVAEAPRSSPPTARAPST